MKKRITLFLAVLMLVASVAVFAACGGKKDPADPQNTAEATPASTAENTPEGGDEGASAASAGARVRPTLDNADQYFTDEGHPLSDFAVKIDGNVYFPGVTTVQDFLDDGWEISQDAQALGGEGNPSAIIPYMRKDGMKITVSIMNPSAAKQATPIGNCILNYIKFDPEDVDLSRFELPYGVTADMTADEADEALTAANWDVRNEDGTVSTYDYDNLYITIEFTDGVMTEFESGSLIVEPSLVID